MAAGSEQTTQPARAPKPRDYRCEHCGRLLYRAALPDEAYVETRCPKCGRMSVVKKKGMEKIVDM